MQFIILFLKVGGKFLETVIPHMSPAGRVAICGSISQYNNESKTKSGNNNSNNIKVFHYLNFIIIQILIFLGIFR